MLAQRKWVLLVIWILSKPILSNLSLRLCWLQHKHSTVSEVSMATGALMHKFVLEQPDVDAMILMLYN